ncbi:hypothetical protein Bca4012_012988 [Brassica carinata]
MGTRTDLRGFLKQSQKKTSDERSSSYLINSAVPPGGSHSRKECDEVVKYMSKLPGYLQGEKESNVVLNVGVLDWGRLEKWKHCRADTSGKCERKVSSTTTTLGTVPNATHRRCKIDDDDHHQVHASCSNLGKKVKASRDLQHGVGCTLEPELASSSSRESSLNKQEMPTCSYKLSARDHERVRSRRSRSSSGLLSTMGNSGGSLKGRSFVVRDKETEKRAGEVYAQEARERGKQCVDKFDGEEKSVGGSNACEQQEVSNIVLLRSRRKQSRNTTLSSEMPSSSLDDNAKLVAREVNRSLDFERDSSEDIMLPPLLGVDLSAKTEPAGTRTRSRSRIFDQEKKRDPSSPSKRFSFSFGRLSRSFNFKEEDSSASDDDTIKSDSMRLDGSACPSYPEEKKNLQCGSRVSHLRRLLDPLLKPKGSENVLQDEKKKQYASRTRALLQLTIRNGIPLFQFVVDDDNKSRSILGATMKSSDASSLVKDDSVQYCTFYSVNEVKKKKSGSWLIQHGHKDKQQQQHRFVYNVVGEMRLCNYSTEQKSENRTSVIRESVLVDESEGVKGRKEVAAVVIKKKKPAEEENGETTTVIIPGGVHSIPEKGAPTPLIRRWRSGGCCDCGGWDVGCKLHVLSNKTFLHDLFDQTFKLFDHEESDKTSGPVLAMTELKRGIYRVEFGSFLSPLQAFFVCVTVITCASEEVTVSKTTGKSSSPFAPPLSPVGRA